jgi:hypothetical protein
MSWLSKSRKVLSWCIYTTTLELILLKMSDNSHARSAWWLETKSYAPAPPPASAIALAATSQKFSLTIFLLRAPPEKKF